MKKLQIVILLSALIAAASIAAAGCAASASGASVPERNTRESFVVRYGEVVQTRVVEIEGEVGGLGRLGGALIGYSIGRGGDDWYDRAPTVEAIAGGVAGAVAGEAIERQLRTRLGLQITVYLRDRDETIAVVQDMDQQFAAGDRVLLLMGDDGSTRVQPI